MQRHVRLENALALAHGVLIAHVAPCPCCVTCLQERLLLAATACADVRTCAQMLLAGANPNVAVQGGIAPCHVACLTHFSEPLFDCLLDGGADVNALSEAAGCPLHLAVRSGASAEHVEKLCAQLEIEVDKRQADGATALHVAVAMAESAAHEADRFLGRKHKAGGGKRGNRSPSPRRGPRAASPAKRGAARGAGSARGRGQAKRGGSAEEDDELAQMSPLARARAAAAAHASALRASESACVLLVRGADCTEPDEFGDRPQPWLRALRADAELRALAAMRQQAQQRPQREQQQLVLSRRGSRGSARRALGSSTARPRDAPPMPASELVLRVARTLAPSFLQMASHAGPAALRAAAAAERAAAVAERAAAAQERRAAQALKARNAARARPLTAGGAVGAPLGAPAEQKGARTGATAVRSEAVPPEGQSAAVGTDVPWGPPEALPRRPSTAPAPQEATRQAGGQGAPRQVQAYGNGGVPLGETLPRPPRSILTSARAFAAAAADVPTWHRPLPGKIQFTDAARGRF